METTPMHSSFNFSSNKPALSRDSAAPQTAKSSTAEGLTASRIKGFTLIELLVVITIIAVLAGLLFPAMGAVRTQARKASAKNDVTQIVNAVKAFYLEYGKYPAGSGHADSALLQELTGESATGINKRQIRFLEVPPAKNGRNGIIGAETGTVDNSDAANGDWADPWGNKYIVIIDSDYKNEVTMTGLRPSSHNEKVKTGVIAASKGNPDHSAGDPVMSWK